MTRRAHRRSGLAAIAVVALAALGAACAPVAPAPPPPAPKPAPKPASGTSANCPSGTGSGTTAASFVAVVDDPGASAPDVYTFEARTPAEKQEAVDELEDKGEVVSVEPDTPVSIVEDESSTTTAPDESTTSSSAPVSTTTSTTQAAPTTTTAPVPSEAEAPVGVQVSTNDPRYSEQYGLPQSGFPGAWSAGYDGTGMVIAVVDTGVQADHPDLSGHVLSGYDFVCGKAGTSVDPHGHGTHVSGIAAARDNSTLGLGGAPDARILPVRVLGSSGSGSTADVAAGINWAVDHGADVINLSLGGGSALAMQSAVENAESEGVVVVAAAGNGSTSSKLYPAGFDDDVIAVGASIKSQSSPPYDPPYTKASYSNYGSWVDIGAPGSSVYSTYKGAAFQSLSGTSMATPFVTAAAALVLEKCSSSVPTFAEVLAYLQAGATNPVANLGGANHLDIAAALAKNPCP